MGAGNTLTKIGGGEIRMNGTTDFTFEKLLISGGGYSLGQAQVNGRDGQLGAVPGSFMQDQVTLDGGFLRFNSSAAIVVDANRGITIGPSGGALLPSTTATIPGKITGPGNLTIGTDSATLGGAIILNSTDNDWAGTTTISSGTLQLGASGVIPDSTAITFGGTRVSSLNVNGMTETIGSLASPTSSTTIGAVVLGSGTLTVGGDGSSTLYSGLVSGAGGKLIKEGAGTMTIIRNWTNTGGVVINDGVIMFGAGSAGLNEVGLLTVNTAGAFDMNGINDTIGDIAGDGQVLLGGTTTGLTLASNATTTFSGKLTNSSVPGAAPKLVVNKSGGSLTLTGTTNDYTGGTTVSNGKLFVNNISGDGTGTGAVTVSGTATLIGTLGGTGNITSPITVSAGGHLAAGIGGANAVLTTSKVTTSAALAHIDALVGTPGSPGSSDVLKVTTPSNGLTVAAGTILTVAATTGTANGTYTVIDYDTAFVGGLANFNFDNATGYEATLSDNVGTTNIEVNVTSTVQDRTWTKDGSGNWAAVAPGVVIGDAANWTIPGQPNGPGAIARFLPTTATNPAHIVTISDSNKTVGTLLLDSASTSATSTGGYTIAATAPNQLIFNTYGGNATLNAANGVHIISAPITATAQTDITVASTADLTLSGVVTNLNGINKVGDGTLTITKNWAGTGPTNINGGTLKFSTGSAGLADLALVTINGASSTFNMNGIGDQIGDIAGDGQIILGGGSGLRLAGAATTTFSGLLSGSSLLTLNKTAGSLNLTNSNLNTGGILVNGGTLSVNNTDLSQSGTGTSGSVTVATGTGIAGTLAGTGSIAGAVTINSGGTLAPGNSIGTLTAKGGLTLNTGSILNIELDTVLGVDVSDKVDVTSFNGLTINGGTVNLTNLGGMTSGSYPILAYSGTLLGSMSNLAFGTQPAGFTYQFVDTGSSINVQVIAPGVPGDYNGDGSVNAADYVIWRKDPASHGGPGGYDIWRQNFNNPPGSGSGSDTLGGGAVPEPSTLVLLLLSMTAFATRRRGH